MLEAARAGSGQTGRTTAKITAQHGLIYERLIDQLGREKAVLYAQANQWAVAEYRRMVREGGIDCDFTAVSYTHLGRNTRPRWKNTPSRMP